MVKLGDMETGTSNVFQVLQDLRMKQYQGNSEAKALRPSTTFTTSVRHHFRTYKLYHGVGIVVRIPETEGKILQ